MTILETYIVPSLKVSMRFQEYGIDIFSSITTKSSLKKTIKKGLINIDDRPATTATMIKGGETIILLEDSKAKASKLLEIPLKVCFEDNHLAIIVKPAGILVSGNKHRTIANALSFNLERSTEPDVLSTPKPVHRLDFPTSGLLLIAKTNATVIELGRMFAENSIHKKYHAVVIGEMQNTSGIIDSHIDNKAAQSAYKVLSHEPSDRFRQLNLVELEPITGRRHQLRIHLSQLGYPILGDATYGNEDLVLKGKGLYLHASQLDFEHPITKELLSIALELPNKFAKIFPNC